MDGQIFIDSKSFECSPVAFILNMLKKFFDGTIDEETFKQEFYIYEKNAKINLFLMSKADLETYKKVFRNEFIFADKSHAAMFDDNLSGQELKDKLKEFVRQYNDDNLE